MLPSEEYKNEVIKKNLKKAKKIGFRMTQDEEFKDHLYLDEKGPSEFGMERRVEIYPASETVIIKAGNDSAIPFSIDELKAIAKIAERHNDLVQEGVFEEIEDHTKERIDNVRSKILDTMDSIDNPKKHGFKYEIGEGIKNTAEKIAALEIKEPKLKLEKKKKKDKAPVEKRHAENPKEFDFEIPDLSFRIDDEILGDPDEEYIRVSDALQMPHGYPLPEEEDYDLLDL